MADSEAEAPTNGESPVNGIPKSRSAADAAIRAEFLGLKHSNKPEQATKPADKAPVAKESTDAVDADDSDLDSDDSDLDAKDGDTSLAEVDDDSDLDEEPEKGGKESDPDTARRLAAVQRTDKRLREQRDRDFSAREAKFKADVDAEVKRWQPKFEAAERFEKLAARASADPVAVLQSLGVGKDRYEYIGQLFYTLHKAEAGDAQAKQAAAQLLRDSHMSEELADLKKWREEREKSDSERTKQAEADREIEAYIGKVTKATSEKTPLASAFIKANPSEARERLQILAFRLAQESGTSALPSERAVIIALEKDRRRVLRELGIDPKSRSAPAASATASADSKIKTASKADDKNQKKPDGDKKRSAKDEFLNLTGRYD